MSVFRKGDVVYHPTKGEGVVTDEDEMELQISCATQKYTFWTNDKYLSFKPWPAPCHERPVEDGVWVCYSGNALVVRKRLGGEWFVVDKDFKCKSGSSFNYDKIAIKKIAD